MASKFICECGYVVRTNVFEGHGIYRLVSDNDIDEIEDTESAKVVIDLWLKSQQAVKCNSCGDLYLWDEIGGNMITIKNRKSSQKHNKTLKHRSGLWPPLDAQSSASFVHLLRKLLHKSSSALCAV